MSNVIKDGKGTGYLAEVTDEHQLKVYGTFENLIAYESNENQRSYTWSHTYDADAGDTILWLRNDDPSFNLVIHNIILYTDNSSQFVIHFPANVVPSGTAVVGTNINRTSSNLALATCIGNETVSVQGDIAAYATCPSGQTMFLPVDSSIVLGYLNCMAVDIVTASTSVCSAVFTGYYHRKE